MFHDAPTPQIHMGSIGWEDEDEYVFPGEDENDGHTLIRVQLFEGRDPTKPLNPNRAQGTKLVAHLNAIGGFRIPTKDTPCYVAVPTGMEQTPGAALIIGVVEPSYVQRDNLAEGEYGMATGRGVSRVIQREDGSITLFTTHDNTHEGRSVYIRVAPDGIIFVGPWGTLRFDNTGFHVLTASGAGIDMGGIGGLPAPFDAIGSYIQMSAATINGEASTVSLGVGTPDQVAGATPTGDAITALQAQLSAIAAQFTAIAGALAAAASNPSTLVTTGSLAGFFGTPLGLAAAAVTGPTGAPAVTALTELIPKTTFSA